MTGRHRPRLVLLCGLPGSGKTTLARRLAVGMPAVRLCPDEWIADLGADLFDEPFRAGLERRLTEHAWDLLRLGRSMLLEFGFWSRAERDELRDAARAFGCGVELRYLAVPFEELVRRVEARAGVPSTAPLDRDLRRGEAVRGTPWVRWMHRRRPSLRWMHRRRPSAQPGRADPQKTPGPPEKARPPRRS
ncbi:AAA family ATPase [Amycolatopsis samaneae]|uniref:AAA family ATPase n=1 Tax=Amycolatopsis samaneae TaxID=664691 RepID=A0ABW5GUV7_9PSEU